MRTQARASSVPYTVCWGETLGHEPATRFFDKLVMGGRQREGLTRLKEKSQPDRAILEMKV